MLTQQQEDPPEPVLTVKVAGEVVRELNTRDHHFQYIFMKMLQFNWALILKQLCTYPDDKNPLDEGKAKAADGSVAACDGVGQTEGQAEPDPVKKEGH